MRIACVALAVIVLASCEKSAAREDPAVAPGSGSTQPIKPPFKPTGNICEQYVQTLEHIAQCPQVPADTQASVRAQIPTLRQMYRDYGSVESAKTSCKLALDATTKAFQQLGCL